MDATEEPFNRQQRPERSGQRHHPTGLTGSRSGMVRGTLIDPNLRRSREGGNPVTISQLVEMQWHWIPDIASRFRDDGQNQSFPRNPAEPCAPMPQLPGDTPFAELPRLANYAPSARGLVCSGR